MSWIHNTGPEVNPWILLFEYCGGASDLRTLLSVPIIYISSETNEWVTFKMPTKNYFFLILSAYYFLKVHLHTFSKIKSQKESKKSRNQGFSYYFYMMIEGSRAGSGSIPLTNESGSGSGRPKNRWIRIRIPNTAQVNPRLSWAFCTVFKKISRWIVFYWGHIRRQTQLFKGMYCKTQFKPDLSRVLAQIFLSQWLQFYESVAPVLARIFGQAGWWRTQGACAAFSLLFP